MNPTTVSENRVARQRHRRFEVGELIDVRMFGGPAFLLNVAVGGVAIQAMETLDPGTLFSLAFTLPESDREMQGFGKVVWSDRSGRAGLKFVGISTFDYARLKSWVAARERVN
jgi:PilZ domain